MRATCRQAPRKSRLLQNLNYRRLEELAPAPRLSSLRGHRVGPEGFPRYREKMREFLIAPPLLQESGLAVCKRARPCWRIRARPASVGLEGRTDPAGISAC